MLRECDRISYEAALKALADIQQALKKNVAWNIAMVPEVESHNEVLIERTLSCFASPHIVTKISSYVIKSKSTVVIAMSTTIFTICLLFIFLTAFYRKRLFV